MSSPAFRTIIIPAAVGSNPGAVRESVSGKFYATVKADGIFFVRAGNGGEVEQSQGRYFGNETALEFGKLTFYNKTAAPITLTYYAGQEFYKPDVSATISSVSVTAIQSIKNAASYTKGTNAAIASGGNQAFNGFDGANVRKSFSVFNTHAADDLNVLAANGTIMHVCAPRTGFVVEAGSAITLAVPGANAITPAVCEVFYT